MTDSGPQPVPPPEAELPTLADVFEPAERLELVTNAALAVRNRCYDYLVLTIYKGLSEPNDDRLVRTLVAREPTDRDLIGQGPATSLAILEAILAAAQQPPHRITEADVQRELAIRPESPRPVDFAAYRRDRLDKLGGRYPSGDSMHWLTLFHQAYQLHKLVSAGVYADLILDGITPRSFRTGPAALALTVEHARRTVRLANAGAGDPPTAMRRLDRATAAFDAAFAPTPQPPGPRGRGR